jgi:hypothetical protein
MVFGVEGVHVDPSAVTAYDATDIFVPPLLANDEWTVTWRNGERYGVSSSYLGVD